ncbi:unnamed protein product [Ectocarpus sp. 12 AP-2014]
MLMCSYLPFEIISPRPVTTLQNSIPEASAIEPAHPQTTFTVGAPPPLPYREPFMTYPPPIDAREGVISVSQQVGGVVQRRLSSPLAPYFQRPCTIHRLEPTHYATKTSKSPLYGSLPPSCTTYTCPHHLGLRINPFQYRNRILHHVTHVSSLKAVSRATPPSCLRFRRQHRGSTSSDTPKNLQTNMMLNGKSNKYLALHDATFGPPHATLSRLLKPRG